MSEIRSPLFRWLPLPALFKRLFSLIVFSIVVTAPAAAQNEIIEFSSAKLTASQAITQIEQQTPYGFAFDYSSFDASAKITLTETRLSLKYALDQILSSTNFTYVIKNRYIILNPKVLRRTIVVQDSVSRTSDVYHLSDIVALNHDIDTTLIQVNGDSVPVYTVRDFPDPYCNYTPLHHFATSLANPPTWAVRTNLLYLGTTLTPNLGIEYGLSGRSTVALSLSYNFWDDKPKSVDNDKKLLHWTIRPEYRYWFCERFNGHFVGADLLLAKYNISQKKVPLLFEKKYRYEGYALGAGVNYGFHLPVSKHFSMEFTAGLGVAYLRYDKYSCIACTSDYDKKSKLYFGPTLAGINLVYLIK